MNVAESLHANSRPLQQLSFWLSQSLPCLSHGGPTHAHPASLLTNYTQQTVAAFSYLGKFKLATIMRIQYGFTLTLLAIFSVAHGSVEDVLAQMMSMPDAQLQDLVKDYYDLENKGNGAPDYYDYNINVDDLLAQPQEADEEISAKSKLSDVAKTQPATSQGKESRILPSYCDPPNPCPIGYTSTDGCIENFENTSEFSRRYQASQKCICDTDHMFECPEEEEVQRGPEAIDAVNDVMVNVPGLDLTEGQNPFLEGQKLPIAAKKG